MWSGECAVSRCMLEMFDCGENLPRLKIRRELPPLLHTQHEVIVGLHCIPRGSGYSGSYIEHFIYSQKSCTAFVNLQCHYMFASVPKVRAFNVLGTVSCTCSQYPPIQSLQYSSLKTAGSR